MALIQTIITMMLHAERDKLQPTWVDADKRSILLPLGSIRVYRECGEEDEETDIPEGGQTAVVDGVKDGDQRPGLGGPAQDGAVVWVVQEVSEGLEPGPVPAGRLDGHGAQQLLLLLCVSSHGCVSVGE